MNHLISIRKLPTASWLLRVLLIVSSRDCFRKSSPLCETWVVNISTEVLLKYPGLEVKRVGAMNNSKCTARNL